MIDLRDGQVNGRVDRRSRNDDRLVAGTDLDLGRSRRGRCELPSGPINRRRAQRQHADGARRAGSARRHRRSRPMPAKQSAGCRAR